MSLALNKAQPMPAETARLGVRHELMLVEADQAGMLAVAAMVRAGELHPVIQATFPLADAAKAHEIGEANRVTGKLVLTV